MNLSPQIVKGWALAALLLIPGTEKTLAAGDDTSAARVPHYVGSSECGSCHQAAFGAWSSSHHSWAWREASAENVLADFTVEPFQHNSPAARFSVHDGRFLAEIEEPDGTSNEYEIKYAVGVEPLQQYLVEPEPGRLQALDIAWNTERRRWYHLYPDQELKAGDGLHWTGPYKTWNARCAECHATGFEKNYNARTKVYASTQAEIGVGCEACHGPGEAHLVWAKAPGTFDATQWSGVDTIGLTVAFSGTGPETQIQLCATCHARREPLGASSPLPGAPFANSYRLALLRPGLYHPDGQILDEVYVYGSFLQSKMYARGVRCTSCHEPHSGNLRADGNVVCTQCHNSARRTEFPTLRPAVYDGSEHHFHETDSPGAQCVNCHMPERLYMVVDGRRDHSFRVPRPDISVKLGTPNACTDCHTEQTADWATKHVKSWHPDGKSGTPHYGEVIAAARERSDLQTRERLIALVGDRAHAGIIRATALDLLARAATPEDAEETAPALEDPDPLVRRAAIAVQRAASLPIGLREITPLLSDPARSVRIEAARNLLDARGVRYPLDIAASFRAAMDEYQASLLTKADFPEIQVAIAGTALTLRNFRAAESAFGEAVAMDPQLADAWMMRARLQLGRQAVDEAIQTLQIGVAANPNNGVLLHSLGLVYVRAEHLEKAVKPLEAAARLLPNDPTVSTDLGMVLSRLGQHKRAVALLKGLQATGYRDPQVLFYLALSQAGLGRSAEAARVLELMKQTYPDHPLTRSLTGGLGVVR